MATIADEAVFRAMADGTRRNTVAVLQRRQLTVSELVDVLNQPQSTVSRHLRVLREAGLIHDQRHGNTVLYAASGSDEAGEDGQDLPGVVLAWIKQQPLPAALTARMEAVIQRRTQMSRGFFDRVAGRWDRLREEAFGDSFHWESFLALLPSDWTVADIGTGTGYLLPTLARTFRRVVAIEPSEPMFETARRRIEHSALENVELRHGELAGLPISQGEVDLAIAMLVLHHVPVPRDAVHELARIVRPGGRVLIVEQSVHRNARFRDRMQDRWWGFDATEIGGWLNETGFARITTRPLAVVKPTDEVPGLFVATACQPGEPSSTQGG